MRPYAVRLETSANRGDNFLEETVHVLAPSAEAAQDNAITYVEARGDSHRHVLSICNLEQIA